MCLVHISISLRYRVQTGSGIHSASHPMGTWNTFPADNAVGSRSYHSTSSRFQERKEFYLHFVIHIHGVVLYKGILFLRSVELSDVTSGVRLLKWHESTEQPRIRQLPRSSFPDPKAPRFSAQHHPTVCSCSSVSRQYLLEDTARVVQSPQQC